MPSVLTRRRLLQFGLMFMGCFLGGADASENWPGWRGPRGDGTSEERAVVVQWDAPQGKNLVWKVPLAGSGHAQPVVWEDRIFLAACDEKSQQRMLICLDRETGK